MPLIKTAGAMGAWKTCERSGRPCVFDRLPYAYCRAQITVARFWLVCPSLKNIVILVCGLQPGWGEHWGNLTNILHGLVISKGFFAVLIGKQRIALDKVPGFKGTVPRPPLT